VLAPFLIWYCIGKFGKGGRDRDITWRGLTSIGGGVAVVAGDAAEIGCAMIMGRFYGI
jgi:hypothetical protein